VVSDDTGRPIERVRQFRPGTDFTFDELLALLARGEAAPLARVLGALAVGDGAT
jgi:hypothetical protein